MVSVFAAVAEGVPVPVAPAEGLGVEEQPANEIATTASATSGLEKRM